MTSWSDFRTNLVRWSASGQRARAGWLSNSPRPRGFRPSSWSGLIWTLLMITHLWPLVATYGPSELGRNCHLALPLATRKGRTTMGSAARPCLARLTVRFDFRRSVASCLLRKDMYVPPCVLLLIMMHNDRFPAWKLRARTCFSPLEFRNDFLGDFPDFSGADSWIQEQFFQNFLVPTLGFRNNFSRFSGSLFVRFGQRSAMAIRLNHPQ